MLYLRFRARSFHTILGLVYLMLIAFGPVQSARAAGPISPGETASGELTSAAQVDTWTLVANAGDSILVKVGEWVLTSDLRPRLQITAPDGTLAGSDQGFEDAEVFFTAKASGTFTIKVDASLASGRGSYRLTMGRIPAALVVSDGDEGGSILKGELKSGHLFVGDMDFYTVAAEAGDELIVRAGEVAVSPDLRPRLRIYGPTGVQLANGQGFDDVELTVRATNSGPYVVVVDASLAGGSGDYRLSVATSRGPATVVDGDEGGEISNGELRRGMLLTGDLDVYTFSATAGDQLIVRVGETNATPDVRPRLRLYGPNGVRLGDEQGFDDAEVTALATNSGVYTIVLNAALAGGNGGYSLNFAKSTGAISFSDGDEGGAIQSGELKEGNLSVGDLDRWTFDAVSGDRIIVRVGENQIVNDMRPRVRLFGANGAPLAGDQGFDDVEVSALATNSGRFLIVVNSSFARGSGSYRISLSRSTGPVAVSPGDEGGVLANGEVKVGQLAPGDLDVFTFNATQGDRFVVRLGEFQLTNDLRPRLRVYGPTGVLYGDEADFTDAEFVGRATNSGPYLIVASATFPGGTGSYRLTLAKSADDLVISGGDDGGPLANGVLQAGNLYVGDVDVWTFEANPGDSLIVRVAESELINDIRPRVRVFGPNGDLLAGDQAFDDLELTAKVTVAGKHSIFVSGALPGASGSYLVNYVRVPGSPAVAAGDQGGTIRSGESMSGELIRGDIDTWTFSATAGQTILFRVGEVVPVADIRPHVRLFGPTGGLVAEGQQFDALELLTRATNNGVYTAVISGALPGASGTYQAHLFLSPGPLFTVDNDEGGLVVGGSAKTGGIRSADLDPWAFTSCAGDLLSITATVKPGPGNLRLWLRLFGRDGTVLATKLGSPTVTLNATTPADGTYVLVVSDGNSNAMGAGDYEIQFGGLAAGIKLCRPNVAGGFLTLTAAGAEPGQQYILTTSQDLNLPRALWEPVTTNVFGQFGELVYRGEHRRDIPAQYFQLRIE